MSDNNKDNINYNNNDNNNRDNNNNNRNNRGNESPDISIFFDRFPKRRRNDAVEKALEDFRDEWTKEIIIKTSYIGGADKALLEKIFSFLDLPSAVSVMWTCSTWKAIVKVSSLSMWACWCRNTIWKFDYPVPPKCEDLKKYGMLRYKAENRWMKGSSNAPTCSILYHNEDSTPKKIINMHFYENRLAFFDSTSLHSIDTNNKDNHKIYDILGADRLSSISVFKNNIAAASVAGVVSIFDEDLKIIENLEENIPGILFVHLEDNSLTIATHGSVKIYDLNTKSSYKLPRPPSTLITSIDVSGNLLAQANSHTRQIEIWDVKQQRPIKTLTGCGITKGLKIDHNCVSGIESTTQHGFYNSVLKVWDLRTQTQRTIYPSVTSDTFKVHTMHEGKIVISCESSHLQVWHASCAPIHPQTHMYEIAVPWENNSIEKIQCDWEKIIVGCENSSVYMWNFV